MVEMGTVFCKCVQCIEPDGGGELALADLKNAEIRPCLGQSLDIVVGYFDGAFGSLDSYDLELVAGVKG